MNKKEKEAFEAAKQDTVESPIPTLQITETDTIKMEFTPLPVLTPSFRFLYRFSEPVPTVWQEGSISMGEHKDGFKGLKTFAFDKYNELFGQENIEVIKKHSKWLLEMKDVELTECEIVPIKKQDETK